MTKSQLISAALSAIFAGGSILLEYVGGLGLYSPVVAAILTYGLNQLREYAKTHGYKLFGVDVP